MGGVLTFIACYIISFIIYKLFGFEVCVINLLTIIAFFAAIND